MVYKIRVILDVEKDVIRDLLIDGNSNLEVLHQEVAKAFGFNGQEMASFYLTDNNWSQGEEIPLFDMSENGDTLSMQSCIIKETLPLEKDKLIYVYDFLAMWSFFVEVSEIKNDETIEATTVVFAFGDAPETAPEKEFTAEKENNSFGFEDEFNDDDIDMDEFDNIDDYDF